MKITSELYRPSLALLNDLYQLTMAYGYWKSNRMDMEAVFHLSFRKNPFEGGYAISCGLAYAMDFMQDFHFSQDDLDYLATLTGSDGKPLFNDGFLKFLSEAEFSCDVDAVPEGRLVFPHEPILRIKGPLYQCQLLETALLNIINFQTLIATKASRMAIAANGDPILEFGLRRAQGIDGGIAASRAAYIGGADATSHLLAGKLFGIPVKGTHAHSWIMSFPNEQMAFDAYAEAMPNNCIFLVDTFNTLEGVKKAIETGKKLRAQGFEMQGIRLDSGDLAYLSVEARRMLDQAGFENASIVASNDLDEHIISSLKTQQDARINVWGIGTKLATAYDQPALGGVYKISAIREKQGTWQHKLKISEQSIKTSNPGIQQVRRFSLGDEYVSDMIYDELNPVSEEAVMIDPMDATRRKKFKAGTSYEDLLIPIFRKGQPVYQMPDIKVTKALVKSEIGKIHSSIKRFTNPHEYPVGLEEKMYKLKQKLILRFRNIEDD